MLKTLWLDKEKHLPLVNKKENSTLKKRRITPVGCGGVECVLWQESPRVDVIPGIAIQDSNNIPKEQIQLDVGFYCLGKDITLSSAKQTNK
nr:hypothetical protein BgiMline_003957 [Biomphalaria glabrata]